MSLFRRMGTKPAKPADPCTMPGCSVHAARSVPLSGLQEAVDELIAERGLDNPAGTGITEKRGAAS